MEYVPTNNLNRSARRCGKRLRNDGLSPHVQLEEIAEVMA
jgi:hypothetical protein